MKNVTALARSLPLSPEEKTPRESGLIKLKISGFRSYETLSLKCDTRPVVITGHNGAGKTNILEALSFLSPGRGLRNAKLSDILYHCSGRRSPSWSVAVTLSGPYVTTDIGTGLLAQPCESDKRFEKRVIRIDREDMKSQVALGDHVAVQWLTPQMDRVFVDGITERRRFLARLVYGLDPGHASRVMGYEHVMRERLRLLKQNGIHQDAWLKSLELKMAESAVSIAAARLQTLTSLMQAKEGALGVFPKALLSIKGTCEKALESQSALEVEEFMKDQLCRYRSQDAESGRTTIGPHRSELVTVYAHKNRLAEHCSTGEQKALLISIIMASTRLQALRGDQVPILLLDEVVAHLDEKRRSCLFEEILNLGVQAWMTGTDSHVFEGFSDQAQQFIVRDNEISVL